MSQRNLSLRDTFRSLIFHGVKNMRITLMVMTMMILANIQFTEL